MVVKVLNKDSSIAQSSQMELSARLDRAFVISYNSKFINPHVDISKFMSRI